MRATLITTPCIISSESDKSAAEALEGKRDLALLCSTQKVQVLVELQRSPPECNYVSPRLVVDHVLDLLSLFTLIILLHNVVKAVNKKKP